MTQLCPLNDFGGQGPTLHFTHANGYAPGVYRVFLSELARDHRVLAAELRPLWQPPCEPESVADWSVFGDDIARTLQADPHLTGEPVIAVGHSLGAIVTLMAAVRQPALFRALVLIEPPFLDFGRRMAMAVLGRLAQQRVPLVARTLGRRDKWQSLDEAYAWFRGKPVFSRVSDEVLQDYVQYGTRAGVNDERVLHFSKQWEARIYTTISNHAPLIRQCRVPVLAIRGARSDTLTPSVWQQWQRLASPGDRFVEVPDTGHLLPLESPQQIAAVIRDELPALLERSGQVQ